MTVNRKWREIHPCNQSQSSSVLCEYLDGILNTQLGAFAVFLGCPEAQQSHVVANFTCLDSELCGFRYVVFTELIHGQNKD